MMEERLEMASEEKIRSRRSYKEFKDWLTFLNTNPDKKALLEKFHAVKDNASGYGSQRNADAAWESLQLVMREGGVV